MHLPAPSIHLSRPVPPILAALLVLIFAVVPASTRPPGPLLGSITLREKPQPLLKSGAVRSLPPPGARLEAVARLGSGFDAATLRNLGWRVQSEHMGFATLEGDSGTASYLQDGAVPGLVGFRPARSIAGTMQASRRLSNVDGILSWGAEPNPAGVSGRGVLVGVIDFGFDTRHPAFLDSAGRIRFLAIWDPNVPTVRGAPFNRGRLKRTEELAADPDFALNPEDMHGTHVASVAAGSDRNSPYYGVAPEASLLGVNLSTKNDSASMETAVMQGIQWMFRVADSLAMPCVVNLSLGHQHRGPHDGTSLFDRFIDTVTGPGRIVVGAAGNDGALRLHARLPLASGDTTGTWCPVPAYVDVWGEAGKSFRYQVLLMDSATGAYMTQTLFLSTSTGRGRVLGDTLNWTEPGTGRRIPLHLQVRPENAAPENGKPRVEVSMQPASQDTSLWPRGLLLGMRFLGSGSLHAWSAYADSFRTAGLPGYVGGDHDYTLSEVGGTAKSIISVGAYVSLNRFKDYLGADQDGGVTQAVGEGAVWSGRGPAADGRMKPDISAPGSAVIAALSRTVTQISPWLGARIVSWPGHPAASSARYLAADGTSQATPFVAGVTALLLEAKGDLTPAQVKDILARSAKKDDFTGPLTFPDPLWGPGKVDAAAAVRLLRDVPVGSMATRPRATSPRVRLFGGMLRVEGLGDVVDAGLLDLQGRLVTHLDRRGDGAGYAFRSGLPGPGVYVVVLRSTAGFHRFRVFRE